jgi:outer membrane protein TolC
LLTAGKEVSDALYSYDAEAQKLEARAKELEAYTVAEDYSEELLNNGLANYLEVLTARQNALNSELSYVDSQYGQLNAIVELYRALGGGWQ